MEYRYILLQLILQLFLLASVKVAQVISFVSRKITVEMYRMHKTAMIKLIIVYIDNIAIGWYSIYMNNRLRNVVTELQYHKYIDAK